MIVQIDPWGPEQRDDLFRPEGVIRVYHAGDKEDGGGYLLLAEHGVTMQIVVPPAVIKGKGD